MDYYVYILANQKNGTLYIGITSNLIKRIYEHKNSLVEGFTREYAVKRLIHFELYSDALSAIKREKQLKRWKRAWKIALIEQNNPSWSELYSTII